MSAQPFSLLAAFCQLRFSASRSVLVSSMVTRRNAFISLAVATHSISSPWTSSRQGSISLVYSVAENTLPAKLLYLQFINPEPKSPHFQLSVCHSQHAKAGVLHLETPGACTVSCYHNAIGTKPTPLRIVPRTCARKGFKTCFWPGRLFRPRISAPGSVRHVNWTSHRMTPPRPFSVRRTTP
jgi:hypothetical protein